MAIGIDEEPSREVLLQLQTRKPIMASCGRVGSDAVPQDQGGD